MAAWPGLPPSAGSALARRLTWSTRFDDRCFSSDSGLDETRHGFLHGNRWAERLAALRAGTVLRIGEAGFGTGLDFLCSWAPFEQAAPPGAALVLRPALLRAAQALLARWAPSGSAHHAWDFGAVGLELDIDEVAVTLPAWLSAPSGDQWPGTPW